MQFLKAVLILGLSHGILGALVPTIDYRLEAYNVDPNSVTVSGISSGGAMSTQFHFIYSSEVKGAGIFAAGPYLCGYGGPAHASVCMLTPNLQSVAWFIGETNILAGAGQINSVNNVQGSKVYIFHGAEDAVIAQGAGRNAEEMYQHYGASLKTEFSIAAGHGQPVDGNGWGGPCGSTNIQHSFTNECGYNGAFEMFDWFYGDMIRPDPDFVADGELFNFSQTEFFVVDPLTASMSRRGMIYVPKGCKDKTRVCKLHIAFHGCSANQDIIGNDYATKSQYMEVAEVNNIIVLFPQTVATVMNPMACWDWFGYTGLTTFATKLGNQPAAVHKMMKRVMGQ